MSIDCGNAEINQKNHQKTIQNKTSLQVFFHLKNKKNHLRIKIIAITGKIIL